jgi:hypothetical protein
MAPAKLVNEINHAEVSRDALAERVLCVANELGPPCRNAASKLAG